MPRFRVTAPDGRQVVLSGPSEPTDQELEEIFSGLPADEEDRPTVGEEAGAFGVRLSSEFLGGVAGGVIGGLVAGPPGAVAGAALGGGLGGVGGEVAAAQITGEKVTPGRLIASGVLGAIPGAPVAKGARTAARIGIRAAQGVAEGVAQEALEQAIDPRPFDPGRLAVAAVGGATIGSVFGVAEPAIQRGFQRAASLLRRGRVADAAAQRRTAEAASQGEGDITRVEGTRTELLNPEPASPTPPPARSPEDVDSVGALTRNVPDEVPDPDTLAQNLRDALPDTAIRDDTGNPQVMYHGTGGTFDEFNINKADEEALFGPGIYVTSDPELAAEYAHTRARQGRRLWGGDPETLAELERIFTPGNIIEDPFAPVDRGRFDRVISYRPPVFESTPEKPAGTWWSVTVQAVDKDGNPIPGERPRTHSTPPEVPGAANIRPVVLNIKRPLDVRTPEGEEIWREAVHETVTPASGRGSVMRERPKAEAIEELQRQGYDGLIYEGGRIIGERPHKVVVAFDPAQVRDVFSVRAGVGRSVQRGLQGAAEAQPRTPVETSLASSAAGRIIEAQSVPPGAQRGVRIEAEDEFERQLGLAGAPPPAPPAAPPPGGRRRGAPFRQLPGEPPGTPPIEPRVARVVTPDNVVEFTHLDDEGLDELGRIIGENQEALQRAAGGRITLERAGKMAERIAVDPDDIPKGEIAGTSTQIFATKNFVEAMMAQIARLKQQIDAGEIAQQAGERAMEKANRDLVRGLELMTNISSTAGRALQASRAVTRGPQPMLFKVGFTKQALKVGATAEEIVQALLRSGDDPTKLFRELLILRKQKETVGQKLTSLFISNLLFHPKTFIRNAAGNMVRLMTDIAVTPVAAAIDLPTAYLTGRQRDVRLGEAAAKVSAIVKALPEATRAFAQVWKQGFTDAAAVRALRTGDFQTRIESLPLAPGFPGGITRGRAEKLLGASSRILEGTDAFFRLLAEASAVNAAAFTRARNEALEVGGDVVTRQKELYTQWMDPLIRADNPDFEREIEETGLRLLFREQNRAAQIINNAIEAIPSTPGKFLARMIIPFVRTPTNIIKQGINFTPLGFITTAKEPNARLLRTKQAEAAVGTLVMGTLAMMALDGRITGPAPRDRRDEFMTQFPENSIYLGDGIGWQRYTDLGPISIPLAVAATWSNRLLETQKIPEELTLEETIEPYSEANKAAIQAGFDSMLDFPFMQGMDAILDLTTGHGDTGDRWVRFQRGRASALLGGPGRLAKEILDPFRRQPVPREGTIEAVAAEIPGVSREARPRLSPFGREIQRPSLVSPFGVTQPEPGEATLTKELVQLRIPVQSERPVEKLTSKGKSIELTPTEDVAFRRARGILMRRRLEAAIKRPDYRKLTPTQKKRRLEKVRRDVRQAIKERAFTRKRLGRTFTMEELIGRPQQ